MSLACRRGCLGGARCSRISGLGGRFDIAGPGLEEEPTGRAAACVVDEARLVAVVDGGSWPMTAATISTVRSSALTHAIQLCNPVSPGRCRRVDGSGALGIATLSRCGAGAGAIVGRSSRSSSPPMRNMTARVRLVTIGPLLSIPLHSSGPHSRSASACSYRAGGRSSPYRRTVQRLAPRRVSLTGREGRDRLCLGVIRSAAMAVTFAAQRWRAFEPCARRRRTGRAT
jgi:hypothetical protein